MSITHVINAEHASPYSMLHCIPTTPTCRHQSVRRLDSICMQRILVTLHMSCKGSYAPQTQLLSTCTHMLSCLPHCFKIMPGDSYPNVTGMIFMVPHCKAVTRTCYSLMLMRHTQKSAQKKIYVKLGICLHGLTTASNHYKIKQDSICRGLFRVCTYTKRLLLFHATE